jgi:hypothetical protein
MEVNAVEETVLHEKQNGCAIIPIMCILSIITVGMI